MEFKLESLNKVYKNIEKLEKKIKKQNKNGKQQRTGSGNREPKHS